MERKKQKEKSDVPRVIGTKSYTESDSDSVMSAAEGSGPSTVVGERERLKRKTQVSRTGLSGSDGDTSGAPYHPKVPTSRRGRRLAMPSPYARPTDTAKKAMVTRATEELCAEEELAQLANKIRQPIISAADAKQRMLNVAALVNVVASKSRNLKGTFTRHLKESAVALEETGVSAVFERTSSEESKLLQAEIAELRKELAVIPKLRRELARLKTDTHRRSTEQSVLKPPFTEEQLKVLDARFAGIQDRLLPEPRLRPPLTADWRAGAAAPASTRPAEKGKGATATAHTAKTSAKQTKRPPAKAANRQPRAAEGPNRRDFPPLPVSRPPVHLPTQDLTGPTPMFVAPASNPSQGSSVPATSEKWQVVENRGKARRRGRKQKKAAAKTAAVARAEAAVKAVDEAIAAANAAAAAAGVAGLTTRSGANVKKKKKRKRLRPPKSAAVVITVMPEAVERGLTYQAVLLRARQEISVEDLNVNGARTRLAWATGARILEFPGAEGGKTADAVANKLRNLFAEIDGIKIGRPVKCAEMRISGLDDSVTLEDLRMAVSEKTGCAMDAIKVGAIRPGPGGVGASRVSCPVAGVRMLATAGRFLVGLSSARVTVLDPRPGRCYRCGVTGHAKSTCKCEVDCSEACYRCGQPGHLSATCTAVLHCAKCAEAGRPSGHLNGGGNCRVPTTRPNSKSSLMTKAAPNAVQPPPQVEEAMITT